MLLGGCFAGWWAIKEFGGGEDDGYADETKPPLGI